MDEKSIRRKLAEVGYQNVELNQDNDTDGFKGAATINGERKSITVDAKGNVSES